MITVLGKLADTEPYIGLPGYNVSEPSPDWTPEYGRGWITMAVARGDTFLLVSTDFSGVYLQEIRWLQAEVQKLRTQAGVLNSRAWELSDAIATASKREIQHLGPVTPGENEEKIEMNLQREQTDETR